MVAAAPAETASTPRDPRASHVQHAETEGVGALASTPLAYPAVRCSECHGRMFDEWKTSAHAQASTRPSYVAMRAHAEELGCDSCHAPLAAHVPAGERVAVEGVTCEVCHTIKDVEVHRNGSTFALLLGENVKYGPLCDAEDHYFHKMGCSPLHQQSELCAACHLYYRPLPGGGELPVFTEYDEWREGPSKGRTCQSCHMPGTRAEVAEGGGERDGVSNHGFLGVTGELRRRALRGKVTVRALGASLRVDAELANVFAGHSVPTGLPERRVIVRAAVSDDRGATVASTEHRFGRMLVDAQGLPAPFYQATKVAADERIPAKGAREVRLELARVERGALVVEVVWRALDADIAARVGISDVDEHLLLRAELDLEAAFPRTIELRRP